MLVVLTVVVAAVLDVVASPLLVLLDAAVVPLVFIDEADVADTEETDVPHPTRVDWIEISS